MKVTNINIVRRMPREEYGYEEVTINAELGPKDVAIDKLIELRQLAAQGLEAGLGNETEEVVSTASSKDHEKKAKKSDKKKSAKKIDLEEDEDFGGDEDGDEDDDEEINDFGDDDEEEEETPDPKKKVKTSSKTTGEKTSAKKATKKKSGKVTPYDREKDIHKNLIAEMLSEAKPKWDKNAELKERSRRASKNFDGEDFLDSEGSILESFRSEFLRYMKIKG